jgi:sarcosine oxidase
MPSPTRSYDVAVAGLGAMGSAIACQLARSGARVVGLDRFRPPHAQGSTHGGSRIIREAYFEHPLYVPFAQRAIAAWRELEQTSGASLLLTTGGLMIGPRDGEVVGGALASAALHGLPCELLSAAQTRRRFPALAVPDDAVAVLEPRAGVLHPERCVATLLELARDRGAELRLDEALVAWDRGGDDLRVVTSSGTLRCSRLVLAAGPWMPGLLAGLALPLAVERTVQHWFRPRARRERFAPTVFPIFVWEVAPGLCWYGFPDLGEGLKAALHHQGEATDPDTVRRSVAPAEVEAVRELLARLIPDAAGEHQRSVVCLYTNTPDLHFLIDRHPDDPRVTLVSACSGHGFKFASVIGEVVAAEVLERHHGFDLGPFRLGRLGATA